MQKKKKIAAAENVGSGGQPTIFLSKYFLSSFSAAIIFQHWFSRLM